MPDDPKPDPKPDEDVSGLKSALAKEREAREKAEKEAKEARDAQTSLAERLEKLETDGKSETEKAIDAARKEADAKARKEERDKAAEKEKEAAEREKALLLKQVKVDVKAAAVGKLADPDDAAPFLDLASFVDDEGNVDTKKIEAGITKLLESKPHLAANGTGKPNIGGGARQGGADTARTERAKAAAARVPGVKLKSEGD